MVFNDYDARGRLWSKFPDICLTFVKDPEKLKPGNWPDRGSKPTRCTKDNDVILGPQRWSGEKNSIAQRSMASDWLWWIVSRHNDRYCLLWIVSRKSGGYWLLWIVSRQNGRYWFLWVVPRQNVNDKLIWILTDFEESFWDKNARDEYIYIISVFCPRAGPSPQPKEPRLQFCRRQVFHRKLRNRLQYTRDWKGAVASRCFRTLLSV